MSDEAKKCGNCGKDLDEHGMCPDGCAQPAVEEKPAEETPQSE